MTSIFDNTKNSAKNFLAEETTIPSLEDLKVIKPTDEEILRQKLALAEAGFNVSLDPDEAERAEDMGWEACSLEQAIAEGYDPNGDNFSQEEIEDAVNNGDYAEILKGLLDKAISHVMAQLKEVGSHATKYVELSKEDKKEFEKLNHTINELELLQSQASENTREQNFDLILKWQPILSDEMQEEELQAELDRLGEKGRRRDAIESSVGSFELEGIYKTQAEKDLADRFINLELTEKEYFEKYGRLLEEQEKEHGEHR